MSRSQSSSGDIPTMRSREWQSFQVDIDTHVQIQQKAHRNRGRAHQPRQRSDPDSCNTTAAPPAASRATGDVDEPNAVDAPRRRGTLSGDDRRIFGVIWAVCHVIGRHNCGYRRHRHVRCMRKGQDDGSASECGSGRRRRRLTRSGDRDLRAGRGHLRDRPERGQRWPPPGRPRAVVAERPSCLRHAPARYPPRCNAAEAAEADSCCREQQHRPGVGPR